MPKFEFNREAAYDKLIDKHVLLVVKPSYTLVEVKVIEITQHRLRVSLLGSTVVSGVRKEDAVLLPISTSKKRLKSLIKKADDSGSDLQDYLNTHAYKIE